MRAEEERARKFCLLGVAGRRGDSSALPILPSTFHSLVASHILEFGYLFEAVASIPLRRLERINQAYHSSAGRGRLKSLLLIKPSDFEPSSLNSNLVARLLVGELLPSQVAINSCSKKHNFGWGIAR